MQDKENSFLLLLLFLTNPTGPLYDQKFQNYNKSYAEFIFPIIIILNKSNIRTKISKICEYLSCSVPTYHGIHKKNSEEVCS